MNIQLLVSSTALLLASVFAEASLAQSLPDQSAVAAVTHSARVRNPESVKRAKLTRLKKDVGLDEQQIQTITPIIDSYVTAVQNVKNDASLDYHARRLKLSELRKQYDSDIDARLTPDQQQKLASVKAERRARLRGAKLTTGTASKSGPPETVPASAVVQ
jgi:hypothetical protein